MNSPKHGGLGATEAVEAPVEAHVEAPAEALVEAAVEAHAAGNPTQT